MLRIIGKRLHPTAQLRLMHTEIVRGLGIRHAPLFDQPHRFKLELPRKLPSLHDTPPVPSKHLTRCLRNRVQASLLNVFTLPQQIEIVENYFGGIRKTYPDEWKKSDCIFFKTVGFGALWNVFEDIFKECTMQGDGFRVQDIDEVLEPLRSF